MNECCVLANQSKSTWSSGVGEIILAAIRFDSEANFDERHQPHRHLSKIDHRNRKFKSWISVRPSFKPLPRFALSFSRNSHYIQLSTSSPPKSSSHNLTSRVSIMCTVWIFSMTTQLTISWVVLAEAFAIECVYSLVRTLSSSKCMLKSSICSIYEQTRPRSN